MFEIVKNWEIMKNVQRLPTTRIVTSYNLVEHSFMVMSLFKLFCKIEKIPYTLEVLDKVSNHDILETETGDLMWQVKNYSVETKEAWETIEREILEADWNRHLKPYSDHDIKQTLNEEQHKMFKTCDVLCLWIYCKRELKVIDSIEIREVIRKCEPNLWGKYNSVDQFMKEYRV